MHRVIPTLKLAQKLISEQFPEYAHLKIQEVVKQGHDNRTFRLGENLLLRLPTAHAYALQVPKEHVFLPQLANDLNIPIPTPVKMGKKTLIYPYPFSIYTWQLGDSANLVSTEIKDSIALDLATFLKSFQQLTHIKGPTPGKHNFERGSHISVYNQDTCAHIKKLTNIIDTNRALSLWTNACATRWQNSPVWIHGDISPGNILIHNNRLSGIIDFSCMAVGDPACDLSIAWTYFAHKSRDIFMKTMNVDANTWLRARAWALWKATYELCKVNDKNGPEALVQKTLISELLEKS